MRDHKNSVPWIKKYIPKKVKDIKGQDSAVQQLSGFVKEFKKQKKRAMILYGPSGTGKSCSVHTIAEELGYEVIEVNASDVRNADAITSILGNALKQQSLFSKGKIILFDEIDGLSGTKDRGGIQALQKLIAEAKFPIVLTANDPWNSKFSTLRSKCVLVEFKSLANNDMFEVLKKICENEGIKYDESTLKSLARREDGDLRAAINDLQGLARGKELKPESLEGLSDRNKTESIMNALRLIFKTTQAGVAVSSLDNVPETMDASMMWIDENLPKEYTKPEDLSRAYASLAKADIFKRRIMRWQHWRFLVYVNALMTAGVAVAKDEKYKSFVQYGPTKRILKIWQANMRYQKRKAIASKIAEKTHSSQKDILKSTMPYIQAIFQNNKEEALKISEELELDKEEIAWLKK